MDGLPLFKKTHFTYKREELVIIAHNYIIKFPVLISTHFNRLSYKLHQSCSDKMFPLKNDKNYPV